MRKNRNAIQKKVLITGGSRGLGLALAREFLKIRASVAILARDAAELSRGQEMLWEEFPGSRIMTICADVTAKSDVDRAVNEALSGLGGLDVLINNAGSILVGPFDSMTERDFRDQMELHLFAPLNLITRILPIFRAQGHGQIINICSMGGKVAVPHMLPYDTSKFALAGFSQGLHAELAEEGIAVTTVYPAVMKTGSPIQAKFKGDAVKEFDCFATGDYLPLASMPADRAASAIVKAARKKKGELIIPSLANLRVWGSALFPNAMLKTMTVINGMLPRNKSTDPKKGSEVKNKAPTFNKYFRQKSIDIERRYNQEA